jgi:hypothetical protein
MPIPARAAKCLVSKRARNWSDLSRIGSVRVSDPIRQRASLRDARRTASLDTFGAQTLIDGFSLWLCDSVARCLSPGLRRGRITPTHVFFEFREEAGILDLPRGEGPEQRATTVGALEATSRSGLERMGVTRAYLKPGDTVKARCHPLRDKNNGCLLGFLKVQDGSVKDWDGGNAPIPDDF